MASTAELIAAGVAQASAGKSLDSNSIDSGVDTSLSSATAELEDVTQSENSTLEDLLPGSEDTQKDSSEQDQKAPAKASKSDKPAQETSQKEVITVTDESGRKRKVEVDYSDREATKKAHLLAAGARKWQAERDQAIQSSKAKEAEFGELKNNWNFLEGAYQKGGIEGLVDLLEGRSGAFKEHVKKQAEREAFIANATPQELKSLQEREAADQTRKELDKMRKENESFRKSMQEERDRAELGSAESQVYPVFNKHRFADTLGNADDEQMFDEMLWNTSMKRLEQYEEKKIPVTQEMISQEFARTAKALRARISVQAEKKASNVVEQKKREATENVQAKVMSGYKTGGNAQEARKLIDSGDLTSLLKGWGKYGGLFNGKK